MKPDSEVEPVFIKGLKCAAIDRVITESLTWDTFKRKGYY